MSLVDVERTRVLSGKTVAHAVLTALGGYLVVTSFGYGLTTEDGWIGPGFLPLVIGGLLALLAGWQLVVHALGLPGAGAGSAADAVSTPSTNSGGTDVFGRTERERVRQLWTVVAAMTAAVLLVPLLGFPLALGLLVFFISAWVEHRPPLTAAIITVASIAVVYLVFVVFLAVPLPGGALGLGA